MSENDTAVPAGASASITTNGLTFEVTVLSSRQRYGHTDLLVTPKTGSGQRWVEHTKVVIAPVG